MAWGDELVQRAAKQREEEGYAQVRKKTADELKIAEEAQCRQAMKGHAKGFIAFMQEHGVAPLVVHHVYSRSVPPDSSEDVVAASLYRGWPIGAKCLVLVDGRVLLRDHTTYGKLVFPYSLSGGALSTNTELTDYQIEGYRLHELQVWEESAVRMLANPTSSW